MSDDPIVFLNGDYLPISQAQVSVLDRGFMFGDGVYEVIPAYTGKLFRIEEHLKRLDNSLSGIRITTAYSHQQWIELFTTLLAKRGLTGDSAVYLQITRGVQAKRDHSFPDDLTPTIFAMASPLAPTTVSDGVDAITLDDIRWAYCHIKAITLLPNALLRQQAVDRGCNEAILIKDGYATEGAASNLFIVDKEGTLLTPPKDHTVLPGVTRDLILELAAIHQLPYREAQISEQTLFEAKEVWVTSSTKEIVPIVTLNQHTVGSGVPGPIWQKMIAFFADYKEQIRRGEVQ
ncbi:MAG: D-amino acid aminotransferase [Methylococcales bacterium]|jgi:D-alanine transaminase|nr:D-amino acid aminotransferase [Methylococcales bacterium]MBT7442461.1 D-amino acid aminotransferase [Methylococcales bacterium]